MADNKLHDNKCIHEMYIGTCAICAGLQTPDEEEAQLQKEWTLSETDSD